MGRLLFPDAADAFGYQRTTPNYERTRGMDAYGPQNIAAGIAAAQGAVALGEHIGSEYVKPLAQKVAEYRMAARSKLGIPLTDPERMKQSFGGLSTMAYGPEGQPRVFDRSQMEPPLRQRKPIVAGGQVVSRPGEINDIPSIDRAPPVQGEDQMDPADVERSKLTNVLGQIDAQVAAGATLGPNARAQYDWLRRRLSDIDAVMGGGESTIETRPAVVRSVTAPTTAAPAPTTQNAPVRQTPVTTGERYMPVQHQRNLNYYVQADAELRQNLINEMMLLDEAAQNDTGENLPAITKRIEAINGQLTQLEGRYRPENAEPYAKWMEGTRKWMEGEAGKMRYWTHEREDQDIQKQFNEQRLIFVKNKIADIEQRVAQGAKLSPTAQQQLEQLRMEASGVQPQQPQAVLAQPQQAQTQTQVQIPVQANVSAPMRQPVNQQMPAAGELAPSTAQRGTPQAYAQQLGTQLQEFESTQQAPTYRAPQQQQAQQPLRQNSNGEWEVFVDPKRGHTVTELQALIAAAGRTGRVEDMQKVQQAIMSAPMDDAPPQSWMDIFSEIGGGRGGQRETTRQQLLQQLNQSMPKALSPMDAARLADIESKISGRAQLEDVRVQQEAILREKAANEAERQRMDLENRYLTNKIKEYDSAAKKYGVNSAQAKAVLAEVKAANAQREIDERIRYQRGMVGAAQGQAAAARESARARTKHETHDMQGRGGDINIGAVKNLQKSLPDDWNKANDDRIKAAQVAKNTVPKFGEIVKKYIDYDAAVKANAKLSEAQKRALNDYYSAKDRTKSYYDQMTLLPENAFTKEQLDYFKQQTERSDEPTGGSTDF